MLQVYLICLAVVGAASQAVIPPHFHPTGFSLGDGYDAPVPVALHHRYRYDQRLAEFNAFARQLNADFERAFQAAAPPPPQSPPQSPLIAPSRLGVSAEARRDEMPPPPEESPRINIGLRSPFVPPLELPSADQVYQAKRERAIADLWRRAQLPFA